MRKSNRTYVELVESVLAASSCEDHSVLWRADCDLAVVVALSLGAVAAANEENALDVALLDALDNLVGNRHDGVIPESNGDRLVLFDVACMEPIHLKSLLDDGRVVFLASSVGHVVHSLVSDLVGRVHVVLVGLAGLDDAVGRHDNWAGELGKLKLLKLPCAAVVTSEVCVLLQAWVAVGGQLYVKIRKCTDAKFA